MRVRELGVKRMQDLRTMAHLVTRQIRMKYLSQFGLVCSRNCYPEISRVRAHRMSCTGPFTCRALDRSQLSFSFTSMSRVKREAADKAGKSFAPNPDGKYEFLRSQ